MRYVDAGTVSTRRMSRQFDAGTSRSSRTPKRRRIWIKLGLTFVVLAGLVLGAYSFLPTVRATLASMLSGSSAVFTYLVQGEQQLQQTTGKTNVLLIGIDKRADESYVQGSGDAVSKGCFRADTMIVASYNYDSERVTMLSIPRDLWVQLPAIGELPSHSAKVNGAYCLGDTYGYPGGGIELTREIISDYLDIPLHYVARIDFEGFRQAVDAVGGVDVEVERAFTDYQYPVEGREDAWPISSRYKVLSFEAGLQHMDGQRALEYARSRHAAGIEGTDFARSQRQEKVLVAFKERVFSPETLMSPQTLLSLYQSLGDSLATNFTPSELPAAYKLAQTVDTSAIQTYSLDDREDNVGGLLYAPPMSEYGGAYVLVPRSGSPAEIRQFVQRIFSDQGLVEPSPTPVDGEGPSVAP